MIRSQRRKLPVSVAAISANALARADDGALKQAFFLDLLHRHYSGAEAQAQLDTAIDWGRYGELYEYAADADEITRNVESGPASMA